MGACEGSDDKGRECIRQHLGWNANSWQRYFAHKRDARVASCLPAFEHESYPTIFAIEQASVICKVDQLLVQNFAQVRIADGC